MEALSSQTVNRKKQLGAGLQLPLQAPNTDSPIAHHHASAFTGNLEALGAGGKVVGKARRLLAGRS